MKKVSLFLSTALFFFSLLTSCNHDSLHKVTLEEAKTSLKRLLDKGKQADSSFSFRTPAVNFTANQLQVVIYAIDLNHCRASITPTNTNPVMLYSASTQTNGFAIGLGDNTGTQATAAAPVRGNAFWIQDQSSICPTACDINQLVDVGGGTLRLGKAQNYAAAQAFVNPPAAGMINAFQLNQNYVAANWGNANIFTIVVMLGVNINNNLVVSYLALDQNGSFIAASSMQDTNPWAYTGVTLPN